MSTPPRNSQLSAEEVITNLLAREMSSQVHVLQPDFAGLENAYTDDATVIPIDLSPVAPNIVVHGFGD